MVENFTNAKSKIDTADQVICSLKKENEALNSEKGMYVITTFVF